VVRARLAAAFGAGIAVGLAGLLWLEFGRSALILTSPEPDARVGVDGVELLARFEPEGAVEPATVRVLLNGADVTDQCLTGRNGIHAEFHGLLDGENLLRVEAFVHGPAGILFEQSREVRVWFRPPLEFDRG
jgi:hypothetical protein